MPYRFFNILVEIGSESFTIVEQIASLYAQFADDSGDAPLFRYIIHCLNGDYVIIRDGQRTTAVPKTDSPVLVLEDVLMADLAKEIPGLLLLHAAVLARDNSAVLFPGPSGAGKSTLSLALASRGWVYLSDEIAPVNKQDLRVRPFLRGIRLRPASFKFFPHLREVANAPREGRHFLRLSELPISRAEGALEVKSLVFPEFRPGAKPRLMAFPKAMAAIVLAKCCLSFDRDGGETLRVIERMVKSAECFRFEVGEIWESCDLIEDFHAGRNHREFKAECLTN